MSDLNSYNFTGRLGADADCKYTQGGTAIWTARVAVGYGYGDNKGTNWLTVKTFGKRAEGLAKLELRKGAQIGGSGEVQVREFDRKDGSKGTSVEVIVQDVVLFGGKPADSPAPRHNERGGGPVRPARHPAADLEEGGDSIPFATNWGAF